MSILYVGTVSPAAYKMTITPGDSTLDMSTVTAVSFKVQKHDGSLVTWAATIIAQSTTSLTARYPFDLATSPIDIPGKWKVYALLTIPGGFARSQTAIITVKDPYEANNG